MPAQPRILIVDDDPLVAESLAEFLRQEGFSTATAQDGQEAMALLDGLEQPPEPSSEIGGRSCHKSGSTLKLASSHEDAKTVQEGDFGVVVTDLSMPRCNGLELLRALRQKHESIVPVVITGYGKIESAVEAVKLGAVDYLTKPVVDDELRIAVNKAIRQHALIDENQTLRDQLTERFGLGSIVGSDYRMQKVYDLVTAVAPSRTTVLIEGESGTGKTMIAHAIHTSSPRSAGPFVTFACGSIPETLLESELFGHVRGAFTGADTDKPGKILAAQGGTLFIDEINSATPALQLKLLRVLQEKRFEPLGSTQTIAVDVRFVLATNQSLTQLVAEGQFREDLFYRINVVNIALPPLRERLGDIPLLARHFLEKYQQETGKNVTGFSEAAMAAMQKHAWPGNVRELENAIERAVVLSSRPTIDVQDLPEKIAAGASADGIVSAADAAAGQKNLYTPALDGGWTPTGLETALAEPEKQIILAALRANDWNRQETARQLGINRTTLYKKIKQFNLDTPEGFAA